MTQAIAARRDGDSFQARLFWLKAARLLNPDSGVLKVGFESGPKGYDDIWVEYDTHRAPQSQFGESLAKEFLQCKWHVSSGIYTHGDLIKPEFINASAKSLLQRAYDAFRLHRTIPSPIRYKFVTNWSVDPADQLAALIKSRSHTLRIDQLFQGSTDRGANAQVRKLWREHLGIDDRELRVFAASLGFSRIFESLEELREQLDIACLAFGLRGIPTESSAVIYDEIVRQWASQGRTSFDRESFRKACAQENLLTEGRGRSVVYGVKSFEHSIDSLEDRCEEVLNLVPEFDERFIRNSSDWRGKLYPELKTFLLRAARGQSRVRLALDAHTTLAFVAGSILHRKSGRIVEIEQRTPARVIWSQDDSSASPEWPAWEFQSHTISEQGKDVAVAVCLTHAIEPKVRQFIEGRSSIGSLIVAMPTCGASSRSVLSGAHASWLAEGLALHLKAVRESDTTDAARQFHVFIAAPNGFTFFAGQHFNLMGALTLYEFDFEGGRGGNYCASWSSPDSDGAVIPG